MSYGVAGAANVIHAITTTWTKGDWNKVMTALQDLAWLEAVIP